MSLERKSDILFHYKSFVKVGESERYIITYNLYDDEEIPSDISLDSLWIRIKNVEPLSFRAGYLMGPFILYCDLRTEKYHHSQKIVASVDQPRFEPNLQAQQHCLAELSLHNIQKKYVWVVDVVSQIIFATNTSVSFEISIGKSVESLNDTTDLLPQLHSFSNKLLVNRLTSLDLWKLPTQLSLKQPKKKHLVILTHGLHSNVTNDMVYIQEQIYKAQENYSNEQIIVDGYPGNVCDTEKGIKYLGSRVAEYIIGRLYDESVVKISFIGHSLGGLVQTFVIAYLAAVYPWFFEKVKPINFIAIASPLLGIVTDNPAFVKLLLSFGVIGKTGQDLGLDGQQSDQLPLLYLLPGEPVRSVLSKFKRRTIYANAINDGVVPLYSSSLLFLDYDDILKQLKLKEGKSNVDDIEDNITVSQNTAFFNKNFVSPITKMLSIWAPQKFPGSNPKLPKVSMIETATSILLPPLPDKSFIMDPDSRDNAIVHDKLYTESDIPAEELKAELDFFNSKNILLQSFVDGNGVRKRYQHLEQMIARRWHKGLSWRKVIVALKPDAHNNIMVRRRFANAYGWPVIDHLVSEHFNGTDNDTDEEVEEELSVEAEEVIRSQTDKNTDSDHSWVTSVDDLHIFDEGPTGMISTVSEMVEAFARKKFSSMTGIDGPDNNNSEDAVLRFQENNNDLLQQ
ncbi:hypothetical protein KAFR_0B04750 [Kazachstania africana CBS 2517]|uniref:DUF676 domain-containing protein n=1 Tax=Kazachstania africana (strain ATCC 22294 / BCRC 22015 / CBS 2517 / CECT 1963 / NBRC 1671 / NRRL Y-8276) TaxID=1071382 RepID=H2AQX2_KAZAF|nr:hypothetical protein KAFR_0B04750 [Kazachstania africana CBS 2517]CCF56772.1 hypothetical protein KAFR_0B04750 [Kazachstania africana CBS 2517]